MKKIYRIVSIDDETVMFTGTASDVIKKWNSGYKYTTASLDYVIIDSQGEGYTVTDDSNELEAV